MLLSVAIGNYFPSVGNITSTFGNILNFREIISNSHLVIRNYLYIEIPCGMFLQSADKIV